MLGSSGPHLPIGERLANLATRLFLFGLLALVVLVLATYSAIHHTAQPEFCNTCHIMEPYYRSWQESSHSNVACIECHYEPGTVETLEGKFKALSQLAKYVTRTQGTKPWAEVSDASCMRTGCHSVRMLEGPVRFGRIQFDHRQHLLESRRGRRLRCVTCHSQIVQGEHVSVTPEVCITCHFMPGENGERPAISDCLLCHGPPDQPVDVDGQTFVHAGYVNRGVDCTECHDPVVEGDGRVRKERCHSCHAEVGHIERIGETAFLHEMHVTTHKVECFECHDRIRHGLLELPQVEPEPEDICATCHKSPHSAVVQVYSGQGAYGVEPMPARMYETRVVCRACHSGRSVACEDATQPAADTESTDHRANRLSIEGRPGAHGTTTPVAGNVDCIHCHGVEFDGMLWRWQGSVRAATAQVAEGLRSLETKLSADGAPEELKQIAREARANFELVLLDGSEGAHNVSYVLAVLRAAAERIDEAFRALEGEQAPSVLATIPRVSEYGCTSCHAGVETVTTQTENGTTFPHGAHLLGAGLDCGECHDVQNHGRTHLESTSCAQCHHDDERIGDPYDCERCHTVQARLFTGQADVGASKPSVMADLECTECHGEPPDVSRPRPRACAICHEPAFEQLARTWADRVRSRLSQVSARLVTLTSIDVLSWDDAQQVRRLLDPIREDAGAYAHNVHLALKRIEEADRLLGDAARRANVDFQPLSPPLRVSENESCGKCHVDVLSLTPQLPGGRRFSHAAHLTQGGLSCTRCHNVEPHGEPAFPREDCASCHHTGTGQVAPRSCQSCHTFEEQLLRGELVANPDEDAPHADLDCSVCHGDPPQVTRRRDQVCRVCHGPDFVRDDLPQIHLDLRRLAQSIEERLAAEPAPQVEVAESARRALDLYRQDGSQGVHDAFLIRRHLEEAARDLDLDR